MQNMMITVLAGIILAAAIRLRKKNRELGRLKEQIHQVKEETKALQAQRRTSCGIVQIPFICMQHFLKRKRGSRLSGKSRKRFYRQMFKMSAAS